MTLGNLKKALAKLPPDMNEMDIVIQVVRNGRHQYELVGCLAQANVGPEGCLILGGESYVMSLIKDGKMKSPTDYTPSSPEGFVEPLDQ